MSTEFCDHQGSRFIQAIQDAETIINCISILISPQHHSIGMQAITILQQGKQLENKNDNIMMWNSMYSGIEVIVNRVTPTHRDPQAAPTMYDLLVSAGTHQDAWLNLPDVNTRLSYKPCTVVALTGRVLRHGVPSWEGGERICYAHFIRDNVHDRLQLQRPDWVSNARYLDLMHKEFVDRHGWAQKKF
jgi:hypothetical protein